jgi:hypothetical protein
MEFGLQCDYLLGQHRGGVTMPRGDLDLAPTRCAPDIPPRLTPPSQTPTSALARRLDDRGLAGDGGVEESPGSTETRCRVMPGGGDPRESATESKPPAAVRKGRFTGKGERVR